MEDPKKQKKPEETMDEGDDEDTAGDTKKFSDLNEDETAQAKIIGKDGEDLTPLLSMAHLKAADQTWDQLNLSTELKANLISKGFKGPSRIQFQVMTLFNTFKKEGRSSDIVAQSQNGSGKTLSFLVPCLSQCTKEHQPQGGKASPQAIILADTRELVYQTYKIIGLIKPEWLVVDYHVKGKEGDLNVNSHIVLTTVDSCDFLINKKKMVLTSLQFFVIDEADKIILNDSAKNKLPVILKQIPKTVTIGLFSATLPDKCITILNTLKRDFNRIVVENKQDLNLKSLKHFWVKCNRGQKFPFVDKFLKKVTDGSVIVFVNNKSFAEQFAVKLKTAGHKTEILLGDMDTSDRMRILDEFKAGKIKILFTTNLLARGIDARKVSLVINLDMPYTFKQNVDAGEDNKQGGQRKDNRDKIDLETYLHRCGRTARFGDMGVALNLIEDERGEQDLKLIEKEYGIQMHEITLDNFDQVISQNLQNNSVNEQKRKALEENI